MQRIEQDLISKIKTLNESIWENKANRSLVNKWLDNFKKDDQLCCLFLLSNFIYFGDRQMRELMNCLFRDLYRTPIIHKVRAENNNTFDRDIVERMFYKEIFKTKFLGIGNPSESGCHLLYYLRQQNSLPKTCFAHTHEIFSRGGSRENATVSLRDNNITRYVFIDDFCGTGDQGSEELSGIVNDIKNLNSDVHVSYYVLFGTNTGLECIRENVIFDEVEAVVVLDETFKAFSDKSRYFKNQTVFQLEDVKQIATEYGKRLWNPPLGHGDCQLLIGFHHNIPDNTLPIIWFYNPLDETTTWTPIFRRYIKFIDW